MLNYLAQWGRGAAWWSVRVSFDQLFIHGLFLGLKSAGKLIVHIVQLHPARGGEKEEGKINMRTATGSEDNSHDQ